MPYVYILPDQRLVECTPGDTVLAAALRGRGAVRPCLRWSLLVLDVPRRRGGGTERLRRTLAQGASHRRASRVPAGVPLGVPDEARRGRHDATPGPRRRRHRARRHPPRVPPPGARAGPLGVRQSPSRPAAADRRRGPRGRAVLRHPRLHIVLRSAAPVRRDPRPATPRRTGDPRRRAPRRRDHQLHGRRRDGSVRAQSQPRTGQPAGGSGRARDAGGDRRPPAGARGAVRPVVRAQRGAARRPGHRRDAVGDARHGDGDRRHRQRRQPRRAGQQGVRHPLPDVRLDARRARRRRRHRSLVPLPPPRQGRRVHASSRSSTWLDTEPEVQRFSRRGGPGWRRAAAW